MWRSMLRVLPLLGATLALGPLTGADAEQVRPSEHDPRARRMDTGAGTGTGEAVEVGTGTGDAVEVGAGTETGDAVEAGSAVSEEARVPDRGDPATRASARVLRVLDRIERRVRETRYQHRTVVAEWRGLYAWDCSGMVTWVLERSARGARNRILSNRPVARDYVEIIENSPPRGSYKGWQKLDHIEDLRPGDLFAWKRPRDWPRQNTGHVGFVLARPRPVPGDPTAYTVRIVDATSVPHEDDTRDGAGDGGFGEGTLLFTVDPEGKPVAYGWHGTRTRGVVPTHIAFGRVHH
ncbi:MAG: hypothetical protein ACOCV4_00025 [Myxococcota bacterium]